MAAQMTAGRWTSVQQPLPAGARRLVQCRRRSAAALVVRAGLLDLLRGSGSTAPQLAVDAEGEELRAWLEAEKSLPPQQLAAASVPGAGRGLVATAAIGKGEALLRLPRQLLITPAVAQQQSCLRELLDAAPLPAWSVLALWLAEARAAAERGEGEWRRYIALLPETAGCVLEWSEEELGWLQGSPLAETAAEIRSAADASWQEMQPLLADAAPPGVFTQDRLRWAFAMLLSRLVRLPSLDAGSGGGDSSGTGASGGAGVEALLPWADLLNHDPACRSFLDWDASMAAVVLRADRPYRAGEEVHVSYGEKASGALLLSYGFCPPPGSNPHDGRSLTLALDAGDPAFDAKAAALAKRGCAAQQAFPLRMDAAPWELMHFAGLAVAELGSGSSGSGGGGSSAEDGAERLAARLFDADDFPPELQRPALEAVIAAVKAAQAAYPSSFDADRAELDRLQDAAAAAAAAGQQQQGGAALDEKQRRRAAVLQCLVYERQVLARKLFLLQQELKDLRRMTPRA